MTKKGKLLLEIARNPKGVRFDDACAVAEWLGFHRTGGKGSHCTYGREGEPILLNFQNHGGYIKPYQARQLKTMVEKYAHQISD